MLCHAQTLLNNGLEIRHQSGFLEKSPDLMLTLSLPWNKILPELGRRIGVTIQVVNNTSQTNGRVIRAYCHRLSANLAYLSVWLCNAMNFVTNLTGLVIIVSFVFFTRCL